MTLRTRRRFPEISFSLASRSPLDERRSSLSISDADRTASCDVLTPQISTFPCRVVRLLFSVSLSSISVFNRKHTGQILEFQEARPGFIL